MKEHAFTLSAIFFIFLSYFFARVLNFKLNQCNIKKQLLIGLVVSMIGLAGVLILHFASILIVDYSPLFTTRQLSFMFKNTGFSQVIWIFVFAGLLGPLYEEIYFRAFMIHAVDHFAPSASKVLSRISIIVSFVVTHMLVRNFSLPLIGMWLVCGVLTTLLYDYLKGYWAGFVVHASANTVLALVSMGLL